MNTTPPVDPVLASLRDLASKLDGHREESRQRHISVTEELSRVAISARRAQETAERAERKAEAANRTSMHGEGDKELVLSEMVKLKKEMADAFALEAKKDRDSRRRWRGASAVLLPALVVIAQRLTTPSASGAATAPQPAPVAHDPESDHADRYQDRENHRARPELEGGR